jgi:hypothetical protein
MRKLGKHKSKPSSWYLLTGEGGFDERQKKNGRTATGMARAEFEILILGF